MDVCASLPTCSESPGTPGELVARNGQQSGTRRPLRRPLTLLGQDAGCDIRLAGETIAPLHCAILHDAQGPLLRDLGSGTGTRVNGEKVREHRLVNGDQIAIGPHEFLVELDTPPTSEGPNADAVMLERDREALRIQAAAVVAQQAALTEEELRLEQQARTLELQETQLAGHLDERQSMLQVQEEQLRGERGDLEAERERLRREQEELHRRGAELIEQEQRCETTRRRLVELRRSLWKRYKRQGVARDAEMQRREAELTARQQAIAQDRERVRAFQERVNSEMELGRQRLREESETLAQGQRRIQDEVEQHRQEIERIRSELQAARGELAEEQARWRPEREQLQRECEGLETRIRHLREQLEKVSRQAGRIPESVVVVAAPAMSPALTQPSIGAGEQALREMAGRLSDQRLHLAEQWRQILNVQEHWQQERAKALGELEQLAMKLDERERQLVEAEKRLHSAQGELNRRRGVLEARVARLTLEETAFQTQRAELVAQLDERERLLGRMREQMEEASERLEQRRREETAALEAALEQYETARRQASQLWRECEQERAELADWERRLTAEAMALEQLRDETLHQADDSAHLESRLDRLAKREADRLEASAQAVSTERTRLQEERSWLEEASRRLVQRESTLTERQHVFGRQLVEWEQRRLQVAEEEQRRQDELRRLRAQHELAERHHRQLREELERLVGELLDDAGTRQAA